MYVFLPVGLPTWRNTMVVAQPHLRKGAHTDDGAERPGPEPDPSSSLLATAPGPDALYGIA